MRAKNEIYVMRLKSTEIHYAHSLLKYIRGRCIFIWPEYNFKSSTPQTLLRCNRVASWKQIYNVHVTIAYSQCWKSSRKSPTFSGRLIFLEKPSFTVVALLWCPSEKQNQRVDHLWPANECVFTVATACPPIGFFVIIVASKNLASTLARHSTITRRLQWIFQIYLLENTDVAGSTRNVQGF